VTLTTSAAQARRGEPPISSPCEPELLRRSPRGQGLHRYPAWARRATIRRRASAPRHHEAQANRIGAPDSTTFCRSSASTTRAHLHPTDGSILLPISPSSPTGLAYSLTSTVLRLYQDLHACPEPLARARLNRDELQPVFGTVSRTRSVTSRPASVSRSRSDSASRAKAASAVRDYYRASRPSTCRA